MGSMFVFSNVDSVTLKSPITYSAFVTGLIFTWYWLWHHHRCLCYTRFWSAYPRGKCSHINKVTSSTICHWLPKIQTNIVVECCYLLSTFKICHNHGHNFIAILNDTVSSMLHVFIEALQWALSLGMSKVRSLSIH